MCQFNELLARTNNGKIYVSDSGCCIRVEFNNIAIVHNRDAYVAFYENVKSCFLAVRHEGTNETRDIVFSTLMDNMVLQFSPLEIRELHYLLESALIEYERDV